MFTKVSVLVPTRWRPERLEVLLASFASTANGDAQMVFRIDDDDVVSRELFEQHPLAERHTVLVGPRHRGYESMPQFFNELAKVAEGDVLMCGNDDMIFRTRGWATMLLDVANMFPDGVFDLGVSTHNEMHYPFSTVSRKVVDALGFIWDPRIFWGDIYLRDTMGALGRCVMVPEVHIEHDWAGWKPDTVFNESDKDITRRDPTYWSGTHVTAVNAAIEKLRGLLHD